jgi:hypothetical protein
MKAGLLERILTCRYGEPTISTRHGLPARCWNLGDPDYSSALYTGMKWSGPLGTRYASLKDIYGDVFGGFLIINTLKVAMLSPHKVWGLWNIDEFRMQPEVRHALARNPNIDFFMDQDMVLFYGIKKEQLFVFDAETDELDSLGPVEPALETVLDELEAARADD